MLCVYSAICQGLSDMLYMQAEPMTALWVVDCPMQSRTAHGGSDLDL